MKKKLFLLMLMSLTGTQTVLHCADAGGNQEEDQLPLVMHLEGDEIRRDELPRPSLYYSSGFLSLSCGTAAAIGAVYLENTRYGALCLDLLKRFPIIKNYDKNIFYWVHGLGLGVPASMYLSRQSEIAKDRALRALVDLGILHNQAVSDDGLRYSVRIEDGDRMLRVVDNNPRNGLIRHAFPVVLPGHEINIDDWMRNQEASVSGLFNKLLLGPGDLRRAGAVMAKIKPLDDELHKQVAMQQGRNIKFAGKPGKR